MEWFNAKEKSAGEKRLMLSWHLYRLFGTDVTLIIAFFAALATFLANKDVRSYSKKYFKVLNSFTKNKKYKPSLINVFRHIHSYAESLVYKMEAFSYTYKNKINFTDESLRQKIYEQFSRKEGGIFICSHIGNIDMLRTLLANNTCILPTTVSIFLQQDQCKIFSRFLDKISLKRDDIKIYPIEETDLSTISQIDDDIKNGGIVIIAGDRVSANNPDKHIETTFLGKKIYLPKGAFKLAKILNCHTYFISCIKDKNTYDVYVEEQASLNEQIMCENFTKFLEKITLIAPYQFYNFYDIFK